jgi:hypothetical protein
MVEGPTCLDIDNPNAVVIHTRVEDLDLALQLAPVRSQSGGDGASCHPATPDLAS